MTVYLNPNSAPRTFHLTRKFADQEPYANVFDVKLEVYEAFKRLLDSGATLASIKLAVQERIEQLHAGKVDA